MMMPCSDEVLRLAHGILAAGDQEAVELLEWLPMPEMQLMPAVQRQFAHASATAAFSAAFAAAALTLRAAASALALARLAVFPSVLKPLAEVVVAEPADDATRSASEGQTME